MCENRNSNVPFAPQAIERTQKSPCFAAPQNQLAMDGAHLNRKFRGGTPLSRPSASPLLRFKLSPPICDVPNILIFVFANRQKNFCASPLTGSFRFLGEGIPPSPGLLSISSGSLRQQPEMGCSDAGSSRHGRIALCSGESTGSGVRDDQPITRTHENSPSMLSPNHHGRVKPGRGERFRCHGFVGSGSM